jgi:hypothetical protein
MKSVYYNMIADDVWTGEKWEASEVFRN